MSSRDDCRTSGRCPTQPLSRCQRPGPWGLVFLSVFLLTRKVTSPEDAIPNTPTPRFCSTRRCDRSAAQGGVPPVSPKFSQDLVLRKWRAHVPGEPSDARRERECAPAHVGEYKFEARKFAGLSVHDELGRGFEGLVGYLVGHASASAAASEERGQAPECMSIAGLGFFYLRNGKPKGRVRNRCRRRSLRTVDKDDGTSCIEGRPYGVK
jgi:hypothetical protein